VLFSELQGDKVNILLILLKLFSGLGTEF
jgi:hypothetical protein